MSLIIDGHNLIPKVPGMTLRMIDDEPKLARLLQIYARVRRKEILVFFDGAPPGQAGRRAYGTVQAVFVAKGTTADHAIRAHLEGLGKAARNETVISSDRMVQAEARRLGAKVTPSEAFARDLLMAWREGAADEKPEEAGRATARRRDPRAPRNEPEKGPAPTKSDVDEWLRIFEDRNKKGKK